MASVNKECANDHTHAFVGTYLLGYLRKMSLMTTMASCTT